MTHAIQLPAEAVAVLAGRATAFQIGETLHSAYWLHGRDQGTATYLLNEAHAALHRMAREMGYSLTPLATVADTERADRITALKVEWEKVCGAMNEGWYHGTEAEALAEIDRIKSEIAREEKAA